GACSVTAGRPNGQRTTTRRKARGVRPIWRATTSRSSSASTVGHHAGPFTLPPLTDALDDEQVLARSHVSERARLARERGDGVRRAEALLEPRLLRLQLGDRRGAATELAARVEVRLE